MQSASGLTPNYISVTHLIVKLYLEGFSYSTINYSFLGTSIYEQKYAHSSSPLSTIRTIHVSQSLVHRSERAWMRIAVKQIDMV